MKMPAGLEFWTADEVAECVEYQEHLPEEYGDWQQLDWKLDSFQEGAKNPTPLGGDGTNGTVETPCGRFSSANDDKAPHWWGKLTTTEQAAIVAALR
jgi:hypothetical protein